MEIWFVGTALDDGRWMVEGAFIVMDGLRFPDDHAFLTEYFGPAFLHIHIEAPKDVRETRFGSRQDAGRNFAESEAHPVESRIPELRVLAHMAITNENSRETFHDKILSFA